MAPDAGEADLAVPLSDENRELVLQGEGRQERGGWAGSKRKGEGRGAEREHARREGDCTFFFGRTIPRQTQKDWICMKEAGISKQKRGGVVNGEGAECRR